VTAGLVSRDYVSVLGMTHGILFILYAVLLVTVATVKRWSIWLTLGLFLASLIPFLFLAVEYYLKQKATSFNELKNI